MALELAGVLGPRVDMLEWVEACRESGVPPCTPLIQQLMRDGMVEGRGERSLGALGLGWSFVHALLAEALRSRAAEHGRLESGHAAVAAVLGRRGGNPARLAHHLESSGHRVAAIEPLLRAVRDRLETGDLREAGALLGSRDRLLDAEDFPPGCRPRVEGWLARAELALAERSWSEVDAQAARIAEAVSGGGWLDLATAG